MQGAHHALELGDLHAVVGVAGVLVVRGEEADRVVAPVVAQALLQQGVVLHELVHRHQLDGGHAQLQQVLDHRGVGDAGVGAAQLLGHPRVGHRQALDVGLVDDRLVVGDARCAVHAPVEVRVGDDGLRHGGRGVLVVALLGLEVVAEHRGGPLDLAVDGLGVGVQQQLVRVAPQTLLGVVGAVHAEAVLLPGLHAGDERVPDVGVHLGQPDALLGAVGVEEAQLDLLGHLAEDREVRAGAVVGRPEGVGGTGPDLGGHESRVPPALGGRGGSGAGGAVVRGRRCPGASGATPGAGDDRVTTGPGRVCRDRAGPAGCGAGVGRWSCPPRRSRPALRRRGRRRPPGRRGPPAREVRGGRVELSAPRPTFGS